MSKSKKSAKKELRATIAVKLSATFSDLKERISAKKFERKIQKASKVLSEGIKPDKSRKTENKKALKQLLKRGEKQILASGSDGKAV